MSDTWESKTVLIVEDDVATAELERRTLVRSGMNAYVVGSVRDALAVLEQRSFVAILLDYQLPDGDAWTVVDAAARKLPRIPVVLVTAQGNERVAAEALHRGVADYVKKSDTFWDQLPGVMDRVSRSVKAEEGLRRLNDFFERAHMGAAVGGPSRTFEHVNVAFARMHGFTVDELIGQPIAMVYAPDSRAELPEVFQRIRELGSLRMEADHVRKDGTVFPVVIDVTAVPDEAGNITTCAYVEDLSERKHAAALLEAHRAELARSNQELEQFAYVASHDLRAPLRAIEALAEWLTEDLGDALVGDRKEHMDLLRGRVRRMDRLLTDFLDYAKAGQISSDVERVDLAELVHEAVELTSAPPGFEVVANSPMPVITTVKLPLKRVLLNLLGNAIKHHDQARGRVTIAAHDAAQFVELVIADDGPGIPRRFHEKVFGMFQTLKPRDALETSGMGLALVRKLVEAFGGTVRLDVHDGRGATVRFTWPKQWEGPAFRSTRRA